MSEERCEICGDKIVWKSEDIYDETIRYKVCSDCIIPLVNRSLSKEQFSNLIKSGHNDEEYLLHSDYYCNGIALQPEDNKPHSSEEMIERIAKAKEGIDYREEDNDLNIAFKNLEKALKTNDNMHIAFCKFGYWLALREIPIKLIDNYMWMNSNEDNPQELEFKNINQRSYIVIENERLMIDYQNDYDFTYKLGD